ncbi:hypothetical protein GW756_02640 [bacterium]|nr:hypothetical protein [bacterium]NCQ55886.1 hypothetical protein [Candidatus Parcubacteria bacterium]NCS67594.1 hypothetical protein [Candidatus Peregrinibacteria bacterium]NCS96241.1 hypothetical protein [bacterium]
MAHNNKVTLLQVRPATRPLQAFAVPTESQVEAERNLLNQSHQADWQINAYAETFGVLSPLSFSVLEECFNSSVPTFKHLGFKADNFNFLKRSRNGQIYADPKAQQEFFALKSWFTPFWQSAKSPKFNQQVQTFYESYKPSEAFSFSGLKEIFAHWQIANFYAQQNQNAQQVTCRTWPQEYEVSKTLVLDFPEAKEKMTWADWRDVYKHLFLFELSKLKTKVNKNPWLAFALVDEIDSISPSELEKRAAFELPFSGLDFPANFAENSSGESVAVVKGKIKGIAFVVKSPKTFRGNFPENCILVAPYFDNAWVTRIGDFKGIILEQGGQLSHSAIVAREKKVPYFIKWAGATSEFETGALVDL